MALLYRMGTGNGSGGDLKPYTVNFECASGYIGQTLTMTYKGTPHAGETVDNVSGTVGSDGTLTLYPMHSGEWECSCYSSVTGITMKKTIDLSYWGVHPTVTFEDAPNGATVTPTDDVQTWLHCANIWDKYYTTISEVVADTTTLNTLIANENANDYLVRSTTFATDICSNESAMIYIGLNDYCANKLLSDSTWCTAICNNAYFEKVLNKSVPTLTSNTGSDGGEVIIENPNGESFKSNAYKVFDGNTAPSSYTELVNLGSGKSRIGYKFVRPVIFKKFWFRNRPNSALRAIKTFKIQGSNDNDTWDDLTDVITNPNNNASTEYTNYTVSSNSNNSYSYISLVPLSGYQTGTDEAWISSTQFYCREQ